MTGRRREYAVCSCPASPARDGFPLQPSCLCGDDRSQCGLKPSCTAPEMQGTLQAVQALGSGSMPVPATGCH